jgi:hypothetical protein
MECPVCRTVNPDDALECGQCGRPLRVRGPSRVEPFVAFPAIGARIEGWAIAGPLVINERGLVFFVREMRIVKANWTQAGIRSGGVVGLAIGALIDSARGRYDRPEKITLRPTSEVIDQVRAAIADAPDIPSCREFFVIERAEIRKISRATLGGLKIETPALTFRIDGFDRVDRASGFLKLRRYPVEA